MTALLQAWLVAWVFALALSVGSLANLMVMALVPHRWADAAIPTWEAAARLLPWVALGFVPVALGVSSLYPWTASPGPWLSVPFFDARSAAYLGLWCVLAWRLLRGAARDGGWGGPGTRGWAAAGLIVHAFVVSLAAVDWIASLMPAWSSSGFGLVVGTGQMLCAAALAVAAAGFAARASPAASRQAFHDLGNFLLMYVLTWAYLAYTQFLVIWSEDIPREAQWYLPRLQTGWSGIGLAIVALHFALPFAILLSRRAKRSAAAMAGVAATLLAAQMLDAAWLVLPTLRPRGFEIGGVDLAVVVAVVGAWTWLWRRQCRRPAIAMGTAHG